MAMARNSGGVSLVWGVVLVISGLWLGVMLSNRSLVLPLFFLGAQSVALPVGLWLFGAFLLGNVISFALLSFLQFTIDRLAQAELQTRSRFAPQPSRPPGPGSGKTEPNQPPSLDWEEEDLDWQEEPPRSSPASNPVAFNPVASNAPFSEPDRPSAKSFTPEQPRPAVPDAEDEADAWDDPEWQEPLEAEESPVSPTPPSEQTEGRAAPNVASPAAANPTGKAYEAASPPPQGSQSGSSYSYRYRPSRRSQESVKPPQSPQPRRNAQPGLPQKVVDVNYRVINPGSTSPGSTSPGSTVSPPARPSRPERDRGWDESSDQEDW